MICRARGFIGGSVACRRWGHCLPLTAAEGVRGTPFRGRPSAQRLGFVTARLSPEEAVAPSVRIHFRNGVVLEVGSSAVGRLQTDLLSQLAALP